MKRIETADDIRQLGTILSVWAHPDDESFLAAGIMAAAVDNGQTVACITATKGEAGSQDEAKWPSATLAAVRAEEMAAALKVLGITHHHWLGFGDGDCENVPNSKAIKTIAGFIDQYKPDTILTFGPEGMTGHPDHCSVSSWVSQATKDLGDDKPIVCHAVHTFDQYSQHLKKADDKFNIFYNIAKPPLVNESDCYIHFTLSPELATVKHQAIAAMPSQTEVMLSFDADWFDKAFAIEYFVLAADTPTKSAR